MHNSPKQRDRKLKKKRKRQDQRLVIHTGSRIRKLELTRVVSNKIKKVWGLRSFIPAKLSALVQRTKQNNE